MEPDAGGMQSHKEPANSRLIIREMVLENFKSYAGEQRIGPFHKSFSSVVGPNGSGKSNVIDAMLFVFGKRAKQVQHGASWSACGAETLIVGIDVSELIHNSTNHRNLQYAKVSVFFQEIVDKEGEDYELIDGTELVVSRIANRDNSSKYFINDKPSNFTEVTKLLMAKGIDLDHNRFLILQGEVEQISMMKPKAQGPHDEGLLEYLEDIIGSNKYVEKIDEGTKVLEEIGEKRNGVIHRVKLAEKEKDALEEGKEEAELYINKENQLLQTRSHYFQKLCADAAEGITKFEEKKLDLEKKLEEERSKLDKDNTELAQLEEKHTTASNEVKDIEKELSRSKSEFEAFERQDIKHREDMKFMKQKKKKLEDKLKKDEAKHAAMEKENEEANKNIPLLKEDLTKYEADLATAEAKLDEMLAAIQPELDGYRVKLEAVCKDLEPWEAQLNEKQAVVSEAQAEKELVQKAHEAAKEKYEHARASLKTIAESVKSKTVEHGKLTQEKADLEAEVKQQREVEQFARKDYEEESKNLQKYQGRLAQAKASANEEGSRNRLVKALMQAKAKGAIKGIHGRLGDLGAIDPEYDAAITMACPALNWIVVDTTAAAQRCVEMLRRENLGVATFLILEKQAHLSAEMEQQIRTPEGVPRLFDLVKPKDERLRVAFYFALRNTVVASNLDQATRIAYGQERRFRRVVTKEGQLIESSGTMSGGGGPVRRGGMKASLDSGLSQEELQRAERLAAEHGANAKQAAEQAKAAAKAAAVAEASLKKVSLRIPKLAMEIENLQAQMQDTEASLASLKEASKMSKEDTSRLGELEKIIATAEKDLAGLEKGCKGLKDKASNLKQQMEDAGGSPMKRQRELVKKSQEKIESTEAEITKCQATTASNSKMFKKILKAIESTREELKELEASTAKAQEEFKKLEDEAFEVMETFKRTEAVLSAKQKETAAISKEYEAKKKEVAVLRTAEVEAQGHLDECNRQLRDFTTERDLYTSKLEIVKGKQVEASGMAEPPEPLSPEELAGCSVEDLEGQIGILEKELDGMKPDMGAIEQYRVKEAEYGQRVGELEEITATRDGLRRTHDELRKKRLEEFMAGFNIISIKLKVRER
eukprot:scaffold7377_cov389-Prasinococcus_capsulatus_cf.AAC.13